MRLTTPVRLELANLHIDACDLAHSVISIPNSSQLASLRWGKVSDADMIKYLTAVYTFQIQRDAKIPRIGAAEEDGMGDAVERREHLVIRDLDLFPHMVEHHPDNFRDNQEAAKLGRIVAHAQYRFRPKGWDWQDPKHGYKQANGTPIGIGGILQPAGANTELIELFDNKVEELMDYHCKIQDCYELVNIATAASHLRKGLARQLVMWLFPICNQQQLEYKLLASPMGRGLYKSCGFLEEGEGDKWAAEIDMSEWGGNGSHQHVYMVRHPEVPTP